MGGDELARVFAWLFSPVVNVYFVGVSLPESLRIKRPCKPKFTECVRRRGGTRELSWSLVWPLVCIANVRGGVVSVSSPEYVRMEKNPVSTGSQGI